MLCLAKSQAHIREVQMMCMFIMIWARLNDSGLLGS